MTLKSHPGRSSESIGSFRHNELVVLGDNLLGCSQNASLSRPGPIVRHGNHVWESGDRYDILCILQKCPALRDDQKVQNVCMITSCTL
jgi:hypothetical protein